MTGAQPTEAITLANPVINGPYDPPARHFEIGPKGPTGMVLDYRRPSESWIPVAPVRKRGRAALRSSGGEQLTLGLTEEQLQPNSIINELRREVEIWRARRYEGVTPTTRKLLLHWADAERENRVLFAQREAAETAIFLAEVSGRRAGYGDWRPQLDDQNREHNAGLPRVALKMATGSGKTVVMAMLIAWHTLNKVANPRDPRFVNRFLVVTPGVTIRDRLRVLQPADAGNYYDERDLIPADLAGQLGKAQILVTNYHAFLPRDAKEITGVATNTRKLLTAGQKVDPFRETDDAMVSRVLRGWGVGVAGRQTDVIVINDEAHHCYMDKPLTAAAKDEGVEAADREARDRNADARVWFKGIQAIARKVGVKTVFDLSATPFYLSGSGYKEGFIFPWTVSDFSLMDAIEAGIVKVPRIPVDDDAAAETVVYLRLWDHIGDQLPKKSRANLDSSNWVPQPELEGALNSLYRSYERAFEHWGRELAPLGETPPVFIVVCPNTAVSKLVYDWIAGYEASAADGAAAYRSGHLSLFDNHPAGSPLAKPRTILVDSAQLESGQAMKDDFKAAAAEEIEAFKRELVARGDTSAAESLTDEDLLREVMNTVGKKGRLGEGVRCVVSVAMLTEGWDANTVTHILGLRAFKSQLLCEQVVGRGLRRRSYAPNEHGLFEPEYANVYGVPFAFIPTDRLVLDPKPPQPVTEVRSMPDRASARIEFPRVTGYRWEIPAADLYLPDDLPEFVIGPNTVPSQTVLAPVVGEDEQVTDLPNSVRAQTVAFHLARRLVDDQFRRPSEVSTSEDPQPWLFPTVVRLCREWIDRAVRIDEGFSLGHLTRYAEYEAAAAEAVYAAVHRQKGERRPRVRAVLRPFEPVGSTHRVYFQTRKVALLTSDRCEVSHVVLDGPGGNTWEQLLMEFCENHPRIAAYVKNDHLGFSIPYIHKGRSHDYVPDFLLRLNRDEGDVNRTLIVEVSGGRKSKHAPGSVETKARTARDLWCAAVNNHGGFGRWGYLEITNMPTAKERLDNAIRALYADDDIIGDHAVLDERIFRGDQPA